MSDFPPIEEVVPHKPPMVLLDRIVAYGKDSVTCEVDIHEGVPFFEKAGDQVGVPAVVGLEYMAQCIAAFAGMGARTEGVPKRIGLLLGCRELRLYTDTFAAGETLVVDARRTWGESDLGSFNCKIERGGRTVVSGMLTVYQGPLPEGFTG